MHDEDSDRGLFEGPFGELNKALKEEPEPKGGGIVVTYKEVLEFLKERNLINPTLDETDAYLYMILALTRMHGMLPWLDDNNELVLKLPRGWDGLIEDARAADAEWRLSNKELSKYRQKPMRPRTRINRMRGPRWK